MYSNSFFEDKVVFDFELIFYHHWFQRQERNRSVIFSLTSLFKQMCYFCYLKKLSQIILLLICPCFQGDVTVRILRSAFYSSVDVHLGPSQASKKDVNGFQLIPVGIYLLKVNERNTTTRCEICSKLTIKTPGRRQASFCCFYH